MEKSNPKKLPRDRKLNFTTAESNLIAERASEQLELLKGAFSNSVTAKKKADMWVKITQEVNALGVCFRTEDEIRNKYRNMCRGAKEKFTIARKHAGATGGGPPSNVVVTHAEDLIINSMQDSATFKGISGGLESTIIASVPDTCDTDSDTSLHVVQERIWRNALERHHRNIETSQNSCTAQETTVFEVQPVIQLPVDSVPSTSGLQQSKKRPSMVPPALAPPTKKKPVQEKKKTAGDVYALQCKVLARERVKINLQIKLLKMINKRMQLSNDAESLQLLSLIEQ